MGKKKHRMKYSQEEEEEAENLGRNKLGRETSKVRSILQRQHTEICIFVIYIL